MKNKISLITGAGSGIGQAIALKFANEGAMVIASDRNLLAAEKTQYLIEQAGGNGRAVALDVTQEQQVEHAIAHIVEEFGQLDAQTKEVLQEFMLQLWRQTQKTMLMVTHDVEEAVFLAQRIYVLSSHPGAVKAEIHLPFDDHRDLSIKSTEPFQRKRQEVLHLIRNEVLAAV